MNRKQRRAMAKNNKNTSDAVTKKLNMFQALPDECLACTKPFDKKDKQMAMTWNVVVRDENTVRLYCPDYWNRAIATVEEFKKENKDDS